MHRQSIEHLRNEHLTAPRKSLRKSNIELLRIIGMLMILVLHTRYDGILSTYDGSIDASHILRFLFEALSIVGVNIFILISGYFGIHLKRKSIFNLAFQIYFFGIIGLIGWMVIQGTWNVETKYLIKAIFPISQTVWFIPNYVLLMLFSPILNAFCDKYSTSKIAQLTLSIYALSYFWSSILQGTISGFGGYSLGWFIILYLTGRVIRRYSDTNQYNENYFLYGYFLLTVIIVGIALLQTRYPVGTSLLWSYDFPLVYVSSICLFMYFVKKDIGYVKWINWLAASSFAVLLFHVAPFARYKETNQYIFENYSGLSCVLLTALCVLGYYLVATLIDQIRIRLFRKVYTE